MFIRRLPQFDYHAPTSLSDALHHLAEYGEKAKLFAGGTDLFIAMKKRETVPDHLINLKNIKKLKEISYDEREGLKIGALVTLGDLHRSDIIREKFCILWDAVSVMASPQVRNVATIGGNLCNARPSADTAPPLIALGATVTLNTSNGERTVLLENFFRGPGESVLELQEILTEVLIPNPPENSQGAYLKLMRRHAMDLALASVACYLRLDSDGNRCEEARIVLGAVAPTPMRAPGAEQILINKEIDETVAGEAGRVASHEARPISDIRASGEYRGDMVQVLTKRAVIEAFKRITKNV